MVGAFAGGGSRRAELGRLPIALTLMGVLICRERHLQNPSPLVGQPYTDISESIRRFSILWKYPKLSLDQVMYWFR